MSPLLEARGLERRHDGRLLVRIEELRLGRGEVLALLGPNGAGKSTLLRLLLGLERADAGELRLEGRPVLAGDASLRRRSAATLQRPTLFTGSVRDNARYGLRARGVPRDRADAEADRVLDGMGLGHLADTSARRLSGGEAQRVAVARALAVRPDILGLDEPTAGMDVAGQRDFRQRLEALMRDMTGSTLLVTHEAADAFALADRIMVLEAGCVTQEGTPHDLIAAPATPFVAAFTGAELLLDGLVVEVDEGMATVRTADGAMLSASAPPDAPSRGEAVHIAYRPEDVVLLGGAADARTSARNRFGLRVGGMTPVGGLLRVRLDGAPPLIALITREAASELGLAAGVHVTALVKATALRAYPAPRGTPAP